EWAALVRTARHQGWIGPDLDEGELRRAYDAFRNLVALGRQYQPRPIDHALRVYVATNRTVALREAQIAAWASLSTRGNSVVELPGDHFDVVAHHLRVVADALATTSVRHRRPIDAVDALR